MFFLLFYEGKGVARAYVVYRKLAYVAYRRCICNVQLISIPSLLLRTFRNKVITSSRAPCYPRADQCQSNINFCLIRTPKSQKLHLVTSIQKSLNLINRLYWRCPAWVYYDINVIPRKSVQLCIAVTMVTRPFVDMFVENSKNDYFFAKCIKKENKVTSVKKNL